MKLVLLFLFFACVNGAKILNIFHMPTGSHYILGSALSKGLAEKGHEVTLVTTYKSSKKIPGVREIYIDGIADKMKAMNTMMKDPAKQNVLFMMKMIATSNLTEEMNEALIKSPEVQNLMKNEKFDLLIYEVLFNEWFAGLAHHFQVPFIMLSTTGSQMTNHINGNLAPYSFVPTMMFGFTDRMDFKERLINTILNLAWKFSVFIKARSQEVLYKKHFPNAPELDELLKNVSLILVNGHVCLESPRPYLPSMVTIGGYHVAEPKKLPKDLQDYLDSAKEGAIFFSLGSNLKSSDLEEDKIKILMNTFKKFPQHKIIWKFEDESLPGKPDNVKIGKWFPQSDLLAHPNMKAFISHGGLLSTTEAVYRGVPVIGVPFYGDQKGNTMNIVNSGYGIYVDFSQITEEIFTNAIKEILTNPKYSQNVKKRSAIINDQPDKPLDRAVFWIEHVFRHGGEHLRSAVIELNLAQYLLLDVIAFIVGILLTLIFTIYMTCRFICCRTKTHTKQKTN